MIMVLKITTIRSTWSWISETEQRKICIYIPSPLGFRWTVIECRIPLSSYSIENLYQELIISWTVRVWTGVTKLKMLSINGLKLRNGPVQNILLVIKIRINNKRKTNEVDSRLQTRVIPGGTWGNKRKYSYWLVRICQRSSSI